MLDSSPEIMSKIRNAIIGANTLVPPILDRYMRRISSWVKRICSGSNQFPSGFEIYSSVDFDQGMAMGSLNECLELFHLFELMFDK